MDHEYYQSRLSAFADRELPADELSRVAGHVAQCDDCAERLAELQNLAELTSQHSELEETDYWEDAARRIEGRLDRAVGPVTDLAKARKPISGFWWKLPAMAASIILVGYIGLHESDILKDDLMIPPARSTTPNLPGSLVFDDTAAAVSGDLPAPPDKTNNYKPAAAEGQPADVQVPALAPQPGPDATPSRWESAGLGDGPESETVDRDYQPAGAEGEAVRPQVSEPVDWLQSLPAEKSEPVPARVKRTISTSEGESKESLEGGDSRANEISVDIDVAAEPERSERAAPGLYSTATDSANYAEEADVSSPQDRAALDHVFALDDWRRRRDSLVLAISDLEAEVSELNKKKGLSQGFVTKSASNRGRAAEAVVVRTGLLKAGAELVEAWCQICQLSESEAEISSGIGFLREEAASERSPHAERAAACLESLDQH